MSKLSLGRRPDGGSAIRQSTALTTVYLLEMNQKFEAYMRRKVEALEVRVAAQQARASTAEVAEQDADEAWPAEQLPDEDTPATETQIAFADFSLTEAEAEVEIEPETPEEEMPDYLALLGGYETGDEAETVGQEEENLTPEPTPAGEVGTDFDEDSEMVEDVEPDEEVSEVANESGETAEVIAADMGEYNADDLVDESDTVPTSGLFAIPEPPRAADELPAETDPEVEDEALEQWTLPLPEGRKDEWA